MIKTGYTINSPHQMPLKRYRYILDIIQYLHKFGIKNKLHLHSAIILTGVLNKLLALGSMIVMLQAIVAVLFPQQTLRLIQKAEPYFHVQLDTEDLLPASILLICLVQATYIISQLLHSKLLGKLSYNILHPSLDNDIIWRVKDDQCMIELFTNSMMALIRTLIGAVYALILVSIISYFSVNLVFFLIPSLITLITLQVIAAKKDLHYQKTLQESKQKFGAALKESMNEDHLRSVDTHAPERKRYLQIKQIIQHRSEQKNIYSLALGTILIITTIYFLTETSDINKDHLASALIFFLFAVRSLVSVGKELSVNISKVMELRKSLKHINEMLQK